METRKSTTHNYKYGSIATPSLPQPTRLTPQQLEEKGENDLYYSCDKKYTRSPMVTIFGDDSFRFSRTFPENFFGKERKLN